MENLAGLIAQGEDLMSGGWVVLGIIVGGILGLIGLIIVFKYGLLWLQAALSGARVPIFQLVFMSLRKVNAKTVVNSRIMGVKAGIELSTNKLEAHYLAKGNVPRVVQSLVAADKAKIPLSFEQAAAIDLAGRDVLEAVQTSVRPKVIDAPDPRKGKSTLD
ncbi:MAG: flotillin-like FloA family protein, partial [Planctomycetota bacterium]